ncbi:MAG: YqeG family HAD IIIA-type phosphatase [Stomatobaculum sp.]|nr:YqeG family HAD IIIA-type phosphatase [Stomatobaculum sp.]
MNAFFPEEEYASTYEIPFEKLYEKGIRGIIFDIDNTLVPPDAPADTRSRELFRRLRAIGLKTCLVSNNKPPRIRPFAEALRTPFVAKAWKPRRFGYRKAMQIMGTKPEETISIGDQIYTDIWGARRIGIHGILVAPIDPKEEPQILLKRLLEKPILKAWRKRKPLA